MPELIAYSLLLLAYLTSLHRLLTRLGIIGWAISIALIIALTVVAKQSIDEGIE